MPLGAHMAPPLSSSTSRGTSPRSELIHTGCPHNRTILSNEIRCGQWPQGALGRLQEARLSSDSGWKWRRAVAGWAVRLFSSLPLTQAYLVILDISIVISIPKEKDRNALDNMSNCV
ncbi:hypothetical protein CRG98_022058 [Punica granatum]|uniref:Uncharacterized protein n=1 Tax=Punica granatum TaxID=22663 RepID=A0A2I0JMT0_PUNGR|nr:hypothetical protein CRG98_022058 [Punica granatum]